MTARFHLRLLASFAVGLAAGGCDRHAGNAIKVGEVASLTGKEASFGQSSHRGTLLAIEQINAQGGVLGRPIELLTDDNQSKQGETITIVKKAITRDRVVGILGEVASMRSLEAASICQTEKVPMISSSSHPKVTQTGDYIFRMSSIDPFEGAVLAKFVRDSLKMRRVGVLSSVSSAYSASLAAYFKERFVAEGGQVAVAKTFTEGDKDFRAQLTVFKAEGIEALFVSSYYTEAALICSQAREAGLHCAIIGCAGWEAPQLLQIGGSAMEHCYFSVQFWPGDPAPATRKFVQAFQARFGGATPDSYAGMAYDAAGVLAAAIRRAGGTAGPAVRDALASTKDYPGATGRITMDANRNPSKALVIVRVEQGELKYVERIEP